MGARLRWRRGWNARSGRVLLRSGQLDQLRLAHLPKVPAGWLAAAWQPAVPDTYPELPGSGQAVPTIKAPPARGVDRRCPRSKHHLGGREEQGGIPCQNMAREGQVVPLPCTGPFAINIQTRQQRGACVSVWASLPQREHCYLSDDLAAQTGAAVGARTCVMLKSPRSTSRAGQHAHGQRSGRTCACVNSNRGAATPLPVATAYTPATLSARLAKTTLDVDRHLPLSEAHRGRGPLLTAHLVSGTKSSSASSCHGQEPSSKPHGFTPRPRSVVVTCNIDLLHTATPRQLPAGTRPGVYMDM
mmetsp:Transcript_45377/g.135389  ORF Transcript_45377/g.135389 Transcript_45377/m.135389 type:complete len:301 (+) Transcript_45377:2114-3016(+)